MPESATESAAAVHAARGRVGRVGQKQGTVATEVRGFQTGCKGGLVVAGVNLAIAGFGVAAERAARRAAQRAVQRALFGGRR
jgi:hypothetical protein